MRLLLSLCTRSPRFGAPVRALLAFVLITSSFSVFANEGFFAEYHLGVSGTRHSDLDFRSVDGRLVLGGYYAKGLGVELMFGGPFRVGEDGGFDVQLESLGTVALRFESPPQGGWSAYVLLGISQLEISQREVNSLGQARTVRETFQGGSFALGLRRQIAQSRFSALASYQIFQIDEPIDVDAWTIGVRAAW